MTKGYAFTSTPFRPIRHPHIANYSLEAGLNEPGVLEIAYISRLHSLLMWAR
jgi:hypothetical protein